MPEQKKQEPVHYLVADMFDNGCAFARCGELCRNNSQINPIFLSNPMIINYAFACEVFLKTLIEGYKLPQCHTHKLDELFTMLPERVQKEIAEEMIYKVGSFRDAFGFCYLEQISNAFVEWRYLYEKIPYKTASMGINVGFLTSFCDILRNRCCMGIYNMPYVEYAKKEII